jgi:hypothetical protein
MHRGYAKARPGGLLDLGGGRPRRPAAVWRRGLVLTCAALSLFGCAAPVTNLAFAGSADFRAMASRVQGILERDLDGDGKTEAIVAERHDHGYAVALLHQAQKEGGARFVSVCRTAVIEGEEVDAFRLVRLGGKESIAMVVSTENPEEVVQSLAIVDVHAECALAFADKVRLVRGDAAEVHVPASLRGGVRIASDGAAVAIVDAPQYLRLAGVGEEVQFLTQVRQRDLVAGAKGIEVQEQVLHLVNRVPTVVSWQGEGAAAQALPELTDGSDATAFVLRPAEQGLLRITSETPLLFLELHYGCDADDAASLTLQLDGGDAVIAVGERPAAGSFVAAVGQSRAAARWREDLLALKQESQELAFNVGPLAGARCLREVRGHSFGLPTAPAAAKEGGE